MVVNRELSRIRDMFGSSLVSAAVDSGDALLAVSDPAGRGWTGTAWIIEIRPDPEATELTVFLSASPPSKQRPRVHLWGVDIRDDGRQSEPLHGHVVERDPQRRRPFVAGRN